MVVTTTSDTSQVTIIANISKYIVVLVANNSDRKSHIGAPVDWFNFESYQKKL